MICMCGGHPVIVGSNDLHDSNRVSAVLSTITRLRVEHSLHYRVRIRLWEIANVWLHVYLPDSFAHRTSQNLTFEG